jgi:cytoskeletal protein RodZ
MILIEIGRKLRRQRESLNLKISDIERFTHLRQKYIEALEKGDLTDLPSPVQGRGMLSIYARFLNMDDEACSCVSPMRSKPAWPNAPPRKPGQAGFHAALPGTAKASCACSRPTWCSAAW